MLYLVAYLAGFLFGGIFFYLHVKITVLKEHGRIDMINRLIHKYRFNTWIVKDLENLK